MGSATEVADALAAYARLGISTFILSDTPYREEAERVGSLLLPEVRTRLGAQVPA